MARPIDYERIDRVKQAAIKLITKSGYAATSIELIARKAGVSTGYLYRHHPSKLDLVQKIYEETMRDFHNHMLKDIERCGRVSEIISGIVDYLYNLLLERREKFDFIFLMLHDHTFRFPKKRIDTAKNIALAIHTLGLKTGEINSKYSSECVGYTLFSIPFKFLDSRSRKIFTEAPITEKEIQLLKDICVSALK